MYNNEELQTLKKIISSGAKLSISTGTYENIIDELIDAKTEIENLKNKINILIKVDKVAEDIAKNTSMSYGDALMQISKIFSARTNIANLNLRETKYADRRKRMSREQ